MASDTPKLFWTAKEQELVSRRAAELLVEARSLGRKTPSNISLISDGQQVLPPERQRRMYSGAYKLIAKQVEKWAKKIEAELNKPPQAIEIAPEVSEPAPIVESVTATPVSRLSDVLSDMFASVLTEILTETIKKTAIKLTLTPTVDGANNRVAAPKITVVGLLPGQVKMLKMEHPDLNLRFWKDEDISMLKNLVRTSDSVVCMADFISHSTIDVIKSVGGEDRMSVLKGGMSRLREYLAAGH